MKRPSRLAVISAQNDAHIPFVEKHLPEPFIRIDPQALLSNAELTFAFDTNFTATYDGHDLSAIKGFWYRKPRPIKQSSVPVPDTFKEYSQTAIERLFAQLITIYPDATWISDYFAIQRASNKALQLQVASLCGFRVPPTIITSSKHDATEFIEQHGSCVTKPLTTAFPVINNEQKVLMTTQIGDGFMPNLDAISLGPSIIQKALTVAVEVRVTVVGNQAFAASVQSHTPFSTTTNQHIRAHIRDNRLGHYEGTVEIAPYTLPRDIALQCVDHVKRLGLRFGAIDLVLDRDNKWWFLENNPNGQWAYIEKAANIPIGKAIAELLSSVACT